jgi:hypothetical protein
MLAGKPFTRALLRPIRVLRAVGVVPAPNSLEYLYLIQQSKRLSLVRTYNSIKSNNLRSWPVLFSILLVKWFDLVLSNTLIKAMINEHELMQKLEAEKREGRS